MACLIGLANHAILMNQIFFINKILFLKHFIQNQKPQQTLINFLKSKTMSENIIILEPDLFLSSEITKIIDASIIWRSTAFVENIALKIPSIFCGPHSAYTNVLETKNFKNINEFKKELFNIVNNKITDAESIQAKALLYYLNVIAVHEVDIQSSMGKIFNNNTFINPFKLIKYIFNENINSMKLNCNNNKTYVICLNHNYIWFILSQK